MSTGVKIAIGVLIMIVLSLITAATIILSSYVKANDYGAITESSLEAIRNDSRTRLGNIEQTAVEMMQIDAANRDSAKEIVREAIQGRYGSNGIQATFVALQEAGFPVDNSIRVKVTGFIEAGRRDYQGNQTLMLQRVATYKGSLGSTWQGFFLKMAGYPKINLDEYKGISTQRADEAYRTGVEKAPISIYQSK